MFLIRVSALLVVSSSSDLEGQDVRIPTWRGRDIATNAEAQHKLRDSWQRELVT